MSGGDHWVRSRAQRGRRKPALEVEPEPEPEKPRRRLVEQGARSQAVPWPTTTPDDLLRSGRGRLGGGGWQRVA